MDRKEPVKQCYGWAKGDRNRRSWTKELRGKLGNIRLASVWQNQEVCSFRDISKLEKKALIIKKSRERCKEYRKSFISALWRHTL